MKLSISFLLWATILVLSGATPAASGQDSGGLRPNEAARPESDRDRRARDRREREFNLRMAEKEGRRAAEREGPQLDLALIKEDFRRLQAVNQELREAASMGGPLDLRFVTKSAAEIKKRAARLKENLALPVPGKEERRSKAEVAAGTDWLKSSLTSLNDLIVGFVSNPVFRHAEVFDAELAAKAGRDLEAIIGLSEQVKKGSEKLARTAP